jgi:hypothetical protein
LIAGGDFLEAERRLAALSEPQGAPPRLPAGARRIVNAVEELDRALMGATQGEQLFAVFAAVEQLVAVYLKIARLNALFHEGSERGSLPPRCSSRHETGLTRSLYSQFVRLR